MGRARADDAAAEEEKSEGWLRCYDELRMLPLKARVRAGRIIVDEPTDLPEGTEPYLVAADDDDLDADERAALHEAIDEGLRDAREGRHEDASVVMQRLRSRRASPVHEPR